MSEELKACPWCKHPGALNGRNRVFCPNTRCPNQGNAVDYSIDTWQSRPVEDILRKQVEVAVGGIHKAIGYGNRMDIYKVLNNTLAEIEQIGKEVKG
jgi:hypothetical protein